MKRAMRTASQKGMVSGELHLAFKKQNNNQMKRTCCFTTSKRMIIISATWSSILPLKNKLL
jgi:hypothetical protein